MSRAQRIAVVAAIAVVLAASVSALALQALQAPPASSARLTVIASFYPLAALTSRLVGSDVAVGTLVPAGVEPHDWEPSPGDVQRLANADLVVYIHPEFETYVPDLLAALPTPPPTVVTSEGLELLRRQHGATIEIDPHIWLDPVLVRHQVRLLRDALIHIDPAFEADYRARAALVDSDLVDLDADIQASLSDCAIRTFIASHAAFTYFAARYNLTLEPITANPDIEPTPTRIRELIVFARANGITVTYMEPLRASGPAQVIAEEIGGTTLPLDPVEALSASDQVAGRTYFSVMRDNLANLVVGLRCSP